MTTTKVSTPNSNDKMTSTFKKTITLHDWWLIKSEKDSNGRRLAVAGFTSCNGNMATRIFSSAPIVKAYDTFNLLTADGITVFIKEYINASRTCENGISSGVCNYFSIGFPGNWEDFSHNCGEGFISRNIFGRSKKSFNSKDGDSKRDSSDWKSPDAAVDSALHMNSEASSPTYTVLHKTDDIANGNRVGAEVLSTSRNTRSKSSTKWSVNGCKTSVEQLVPTGLDNSNEKSRSLMSSEKVKYLSNRIKAICGSGGKTVVRTPDRAEDTLANSGEKHMAGNPSSAVSSCPILDSDNEPTGPSEARRSTRLKNVKGGANMQETGRKKTNLVSVGSDIVKSDGDEDCGSGRKIDLDSLIGHREAKSKSVLEVNHESPDFIKRAQSSSDQKKPCRSSTRLDDENQRHTRKSETSQRQTRSHISKCNTSEGVVHKRRRP